MSGSISGAYWPSPCSRTTMSRPVLDGPAVAGLLVAAVPEVVRVLDDTDRTMARPLLIGQPDSMLGPDPAGGERRLRE